MNIITLTTDFGERDYSVAALKGAIYKQNPEVRIVDVSHSVLPFDISQGAYILSRAYQHFPKETVHIIGIDAEKILDRRYLIMKYDGHFFIGADNGILSLLSNNDDSSVELVEIESMNSTTFPSLEVFVPIASDLALGKDFKSLGKITKEPLKKYYLSGMVVSSDKENIRGNIIYIDHYGNAVSDIIRDDFEKIRKGRKFEVYIGGTRFTKIYNSYNELLNSFGTEEKDIFTPEGTAMLLFNSTNNLELAIYRSNLQTIGGASTLLGVNYRDQISIFFK